MKGYQQGDVILVTAKIPQSAKKLEPQPRGYVLAEGEATGHAHVIDVEECEMYERDGIVYVRVLQPATLRHEEHSIQKIAPGEYEVRRVTEVDPFTEEIRYVQD